MSNLDLSRPRKGASQPAAQISERAVRLQFARRSFRLAQADFLLREVERRMFERLDLVKIAPKRLLDIGCGQGAGLRSLAQRFPQAQSIGLDFALPMLKRQEQAQTLLKQLARPWANRGSLFGGLRGPVQVAGNARQLPLANASIDLIWSNLCWHWLADPLASLTDWYRVIRPEGLLMFSSFGVDTGRQLAALGWPIPVFPDMHDIGDALAKNGFADPVMDTERLSLEYRDATKLMLELSALGGNALLHRSRGLQSRQAKAAWQTRLQQAISEHGGVLSITVEVVYGHAWCGARKKLPEGLAPVNWVQQSVPRLNK